VHLPALAAGRELLVSIRCHTPSATFGDVDRFQVVKSIAAQSPPAASRQVAMLGPFVPRQRRRDRIRRDPSARHETAVADLYVGKIDQMSTSTIYPQSKDLLDVAQSIRLQSKELLDVVQTIASAWLRPRFARPRIGDR
jgi:hypothetical protein